MLEQKKLNGEVIEDNIKNKHLGTVFNDEQELLRAIIDIHCETEIELDPMYNKGMFYKTGNINKPKYKYDLKPMVEGVIEGDATNLKEINTGTINTQILDPPFLFEIRNRKNDNGCVQRYTILKGFEEVEKLYKNILKEARRVLKDKGILIFKCQDFTDSKTTMTHCFVWKWALELGFYPKDLVLLDKKNKVYNGNTQQRHFRKTHSYFWVFKKLKEDGIPPTNKQCVKQNI